MKTLFKPNARRCGLANVLALFLLASAAGAQSYPPVWNNTSNYVAGDMVTDYGNVYRCIKPVTTHYLDPSKTYQNWELSYVRSGTTIVIGTGQPFPDLKTAWAYILNATIAQGAYLHLNISTANGSHSENLGNGFSVDHPFGAKISITGDNGNEIVFSTMTGGNGFTIDGGYSLGSLSNVSLESPVLPEGSGLYAEGGTFLSVSNLSVSNFYIGLYAQNQGQIFCANPVTFGSGETTYVQADTNGRVTLAYDQHITGSGVNLSATGFFASSGGQIFAPNCVLSHLYAGAYATGEGSVFINGGQITGSTFGAKATTRGLVAIETGSASSNGNDLTVLTGGTIDALGATYGTSSSDTGTGSYIW